MVATAPVPDSKPADESTQGAARAGSGLRRAARGGMWLGIGQSLGAASTWIATLVLARLLAPADFGVVGMATVVLGFVNAFADLGLTAALIQRKDLEDAHKDSAFWSSAAIGVALFGVCFLCSPLLSALYREPRVAGIVSVSAISLLLSPLWTTHAALLRREMRFARVARIEVIRNVAHGVASVAGAFAGLGYWAIVLGPIVGHLVAIPAYRMADDSWRPQLRATRKHARELFSFSLFVSGASVVNYLSANVDYLIVGRMLGPEALGIYMLAYQLMTFPLSRITSLFSQVMFPAFAAIQDRLDEMRAQYTYVTRSVALISFPVLGWLAVAAPEVIALAYGEQWLPAVTLLRILAIAGALKSVGSLVGIVYRTLGKVRVEFYWNVVWIVGLSIAVIIGVQWGAVGVAAVITILSVPGVLYTQWLACRYLEHSLPKLLAAVALPTGAALIATAAGFALRTPVDDLLGTSAALAVVRLLILTLCVLAVYAGALRIMQPSIGSEARAFFAHFRKSA